MQQGVLEGFGESGPLITASKISHILVNMLKRIKNIHFKLRGVKKRLNRFQYKLSFHVSVRFLRFLLRHPSIDAWRLRGEERVKNEVLRVRGEIFNILCELTTQSRKNNKRSKNLYCCLFKTSYLNKYTRPTI